MKGVEIMSKYNRFAQELDRLAKSKFSDYAAEKIVADSARELYEATPEKQGASAEYAAKAAKAKAQYLEKQADFERVKAALRDSMREVDRIRADLERALADGFKAKTSDIDAGVVTLLSAGILTENEFSDLLDEYQQAGNMTMARLTGAAAGKAAAVATTEESQRNLRMIAQRGMKNPAADYLRTFDNLRYTYEKTSRNPSMIGRWDELTAEAIRNF